MKLKITIFFATLLAQGLSTEQTLPKKQQFSLLEPNNSLQPINFVIACIGIILIIFETLIWMKIKRQQSMITFSVFNKGEPVEISSSYDQSHNDFASSKNQVSNEQEAEQENQSPGIKIIKGMTEKKQNGKQSQQGDKDSQRRKRKRKADKLSDRRQKQKQEQS